MITIVNIRRLNIYDDYDHIVSTTYRHTSGKKYLVYCARRNYSYQMQESPLANPFKMKREADRPHVLALYRQWFDSKIHDGDLAVADELARLMKLESEGDLELGCYCKPKACHCDLIKAFLEEN